ncbi:MAG: GIY-YIG nuclease family protein [Paludibacteraceae bacterium]|nr:GIY-YIG nuclease family protein [Paludibacteraceae bacterium]
MEEYGLIYGLTNHYFDGLVKIGVTRRLDINRRIHELGTAVPAPFHCAFAYKVPKARLFEIEHIIHDTFDDKRITGSEFFRMEPSKADKLLRGLGNFEPMQAAVQAAIDVDDAKRKKNMDFTEMGLQIGQTICYIKDKSVTCTIATNRRVLYNGHEASLSSVTKQLLGYAVQPSPYWTTEDGTSLTKLYAKAIANSAEKAAAAQKEVEAKCNYSL